MIPSSSPAYRSSVHSTMAHQGASYFGYYSQQPSHHPHQYPSADFSCNIQPLVHSTMGEGIQGGWHSPSVYMPTPYGNPHSSVYPQRHVSFETDCIMYPPIHHTTNSGTSSPGPQNIPPTSTSSTPSSGFTSTHAGQHGHPSSPCAPAGTVSSMVNGSVAAGPESPCGPYYEPSFCKVSPEFQGSVDGSQSPDNGLDNTSKSPCLLSNGSRPHQARSPYEWMKKTYQNSTTPVTNAAEGSFGEIDQNSLKGKTRTKDKYRVVYSDFQRLELEKEYHFSKYITIRRKAELATLLGLSERQVKIWFQNRRAKDRKQKKKRDELVQKDKIDPGVSYHIAHPFHSQLELAHHGGSNPSGMNSHLSYSARQNSLMMDVKPIIGAGLE